MDNKRKSILAISGSTRKNSTSEAILRTIASLYEKSLDVHVYLSIDQLPHFNPDADTDEVDPRVTQFRGLIEHADGVLICTPEYVFSLPGTLKNAIEWTVSTTVFLNKPTAMIVASTGGEKAFESLELILKTVGANIPDRSRLLIQGARSKIGRQGDMPAETLNKMKSVVDSLLAALA